MATNKSILIRAYGFPVNNEKGNPFIKDIALGLAQSGNQVTILFEHYIGLFKLLRLLLRMEEWPAFNTDSELDNLNVYYFNLIPKSRWTMSFLKRSIANKFKRKIRSHFDSTAFPQILQHHYILNVDLWLSEAITQAFDMKLVIFEHSPSIDEKAINRKRGDFVSRLELNELVQHAVLRFARTELYRAKYARLFKAPFEVMPSFVPERFLADAEKPLDPIEEGFKVVVIGSFSERKNHRLAIDGFCAAFQDDPTAVLTVIGAGPLFRPLLDYVNGLDVKCQISLPGLLPKKEVLQRIKQAHIVLSTSRSESFGNTVIEAMAFGKPVVSTKSGGPEEIIDDDRLGILCGFETEEVKSALLKIQASYPNLDHAFIRSHFRKHYSQEVVMERLNGYYAEV